jgi:hypothetical protein
LSFSVLRVDKNPSRKSETLKDLKLCKWGKILGNKELSSLYGILIEMRGVFWLVLQVTKMENPFSSKEMWMGYWA